MLKKLLERVKGNNTSIIDGIKIWFDDKSVILVRPSGTEPVYRLYAEAKTQKKAIKLVREYTTMLKKILASI